MRCLSQKNNIMKVLSKVPNRILIDRIMKDKQTQKKYIKQRGLL